MGDQLRFFAPDADGAERAARFTRLDAILAHVVRACADLQPPTPEISATAPRHSRFVTAPVAYRAAYGVALSVGWKIDSPSAPILAPAHAQIAAGEPHAGFALIRRVPTSLGAPRLRATARRNAAGICIPRANSGAGAGRSRIYQHLRRRALRRRALRHAAPPSPARANSRSSSPIIASS